MGVVGMAGVPGKGKGAAGEGGGRGGKKLV